MTPKVFFAGLPEVTVRQVEESFEKFFPKKYSGYIRRFDQRDLGESYYAEGQYGLFSADGICKAAAESETELRVAADQYGVVAHLSH